MKIIADAGVSSVVHYPTIDDGYYDQHEVMYHHDVEKAVNVFEKMSESSNDPYGVRDNALAAIETAFNAGRDHAMRVGFNAPDIRDQIRTVILASLLYFRLMSEG